MTASLPRKWVQNLASGYDIHLDGAPRTISSDHKMTNTVDENGLRIEGPLEGIIEVIACMGHVAGQYDPPGTPGIDNLCEGLADAALELNTDTLVGVLHLPNFTIE